MIRSILDRAMSLTTDLGTEFKVRDLPDILARFLRAIRVKVPRGFSVTAAVDATSVGSPRLASPRGRFDPV